MANNRAEEFYLFFLVWFNDILRTTEKKTENEWRLCFNNSRYKLFNQRKLKPPIQSENYKFLERVL